MDINNQDVEVLKFLGEMVRNQRFLESGCYEHILRSARKFTSLDCLKRFSNWLYICLDPKRNIDKRYLKIAIDNANNFKNLEILEQYLFGLCVRFEDWSPEIFELLVVLATQINSKEEFNEFLGAIEDPNYIKTLQEYKNDEEVNSIIGNGMKK